MFSFGDRLRKLRSDKGYSQHDIVEHINALDGELLFNISCSINTNRFGRIERNELEATYSELCALSYVLDVSIGCLTLNQCEVDEIDRLCEGMSTNRKEMFMSLICHNADFIKDLSRNSL